MTNNLHLLECDSVYRGFTKGILYAYSDRFEFITQNGECTKYMFCDIEYVCLSQLKTFNLKMKNNLSVISFGAKNNSVFLQWIDLAKQYDVPVAKSKDFEKQMINIKNNIFIKQKKKIIGIMIIVLAIIIFGNVFGNGKDKAYKCFQKYNLTEELTIKDVTSSKYIKDYVYEVIEGDDRYCILYRGKLKKNNMPVSIKGYYYKNDKHVEIEHFAINEKYYSDLEASIIIYYGNN